MILSECDNGLSCGLETNSQEARKHTAIRTHTFGKIITCIVVHSDVNISIKMSNLGSLLINNKTRETSNLQFLYM